MKKYMNVLASSVVSLLLLSACNGTSSNSEHTDELNQLVNYQAEDEYIDWQSDEVTNITLNNNTASVEQNTGVIISDNTISIRTSGTYVLSGSLSDGQIIVDAEDKGIVRLILDGVSINSSTSAPIYIKQADKTVISLEEGTENVFTDGIEYTTTEENSDEPDSTIFSKDDLTINGLGTLIVKSNFNDGISSNDDLLITGGTIEVDAVDDGIVGRDLFTMKNANITITALGDGLKSSNDEDEDKGHVVLQSGTLSIEAEGDGIQSEKTVYVIDGEYSIIAGGGSPEIIESTEQMGMMGGGMGPGGNMQTRDISSMIDQMLEGADLSDELKSELENVESFEELQSIIVDHSELEQLMEETRQNRMSSNMQPPTMESMPKNDNTSGTGTSTNTNPPSSTEQSAEDSTSEETISTKGIKAGTEINILGGTLTIDSLEDALHSNQDLSLTGGKMTILTGDDGIHADSNVSILGGDITIEKSLEGIEGQNITIADGRVHLNAEDDGINVNVEETGGHMGMGPTGISNSESSNTENDITNTEESTEAESGELLIEGGYLYVNANGDGLDSNSSIHMTGGTVLVYGPTSSGNGSLDYSQSFNLEGGILIAAGSSGMVQSISSESSQSTVLMTYNEMQSAGTSIYLENEDGERILAVTPEKEFQSILISTPTIESGKTYNLQSGGVLNGEAIDGLFSEDFSYSDGSFSIDFESSTTDKTTYLNEDGVTTSQSTMFGGFGGRNRNNDETAPFNQNTVQE
nr:carbohydrate-binding domain-containing protein [Lysinibacillus timonensis]